MSVTMDQIKQLREKTGAGIMDCKRALEESSGDLDAAEIVLRKQGMASAAKKAGRAANQGLIFQYIHGGRIGCLLELNCETDFVARTEDFQQLGRDIAQHIIGMLPQYVRADEVPAAVRERERRIHDGSDEEVDRKLVLLAQPFVRDPKKTIGGMVQEAIGKLGENIVVRRFTRYELGEAVVGESSDTDDDGAEA
ncbi:MAG: translation elongation factor Ts [Thermomicrobia bacterium]|nr:translation elongation factor Ts [Thermomicrobia bacterium]MCA1725204.1 translation elongation factor Ts [Thermomicrobia bacterium]